MLAWMHQKGDLIDGKFVGPQQQKKQYAMAIFFRFLRCLKNYADNHVHSIAR